MSKHIPAYTKSKCTSKNLSKVGTYYVLDANTGSWPKDAFCQAISKRDARPNYKLYGQLWNQIGKGGVNYGHPGLAFNVKDSKNYDFIYFR